MSDKARGGIIAAPSGKSDHVPVWLDNGYVIPAATVRRLGLKLHDLNDVAASFGIDLDES